MDTLNAIHAKMRRELAAAGGSIDAVFLCPHGPDDNCVCRKPLPGMFEQIGARYDADLNDVPAVGDSLRDLQASSAAGCAPWLVLTGNGADAGQGRPAARHAHLRRPVGRGRPAVARQRGLTRWPGSVRCFTPFS